MARTGPGSGGRSFDGGDDSTDTNDSESDSDPQETVEDRDSSGDTNPFTPRDDSDDSGGGGGGSSGSLDRQDQRRRDTIVGGGGMDDSTSDQSDDTVGSIDDSGSGSSGGSSGGLDRQEQRRRETVTGGSGSDSGGDVGGGGPEGGASSRYGSIDTPQDGVESGATGQDRPSTNRETVVSGVDQGVTTTELAGTRAVSRADEVQSRARETEQRVLQRNPNLSQGDVSVDIVRLEDGGLAFETQLTESGEISRSQEIDQQIGTANRNLSGQRRAAEREARSEARDSLQESTGRDVVSSAASTLAGPSIGDAVEEGTSDDVAAAFSGVESGDIETTAEDGRVQAEFSEDYLDEREQTGIENTKTAIERQLEEQTGADLDRDDISFTETDNGKISGQLTDEGEETVAVEKAPLGDVPVVGGLTTSGARVRTRGRNFFEPASEFYTDTVTNPARDLVGLSAAALPLAAAEPTPLGEVGVGTAAGIGVGVTAVGVGSGVVGNVALGEQIEASAQETRPSRQTFQDAATAELGEVPTPTEPASDPFPTESPAPTRGVGEVFPTGSAPTETSEPFPDESPTPTEPTEPFGPEQDAPTEAPEGVAPESPPINREVDNNLGGPAGFSGQQGIVRQRPELEEEEDTTPTIGEDDLFGGTIPMPGEPGYPGGRTVEGQRVRTFPGEESVGTSEDVYERSQEDLFQGEDVFSGQGTSPFARGGVAPDSDVLTSELSIQGQGQRATQAQRGLQLQQPAQLQQPVQLQGSAFGTTPAQGSGYGFPAEQGYPEGYGYGFGTGSGRRGLRPRLPRNDNEVETFGGEEFGAEDETFASGIASVDDISDGNNDGNVFTGI